jgi:Ca2+-binding EF-hand superfamily protein
MNSLRRNFFVQFFVFEIERSVVDDFFSEIDSDRRNEVRAERFVDVLDQTTRLADT